MLGNYALWEPNCYLIFNLLMRDSLKLQWLNIFILIIDPISTHTVVSCRDKLTDDLLTP